MKLRKFLLTVVLSLFLFAFYRVDAHAETFTGNVKNVPKSDSLTFVFSFTLKQQYDVTITSPTGEQYNMAADAKEIRIGASDIEKGDYTYSIMANDPDFTYNVTVVESGKTVATVGESNPTVSETVTDFKIWFEDGDLCASWNYTDKVTITVTDPAHFNNIESKLQTSANYYRKTLPANVETVQFYIVPSTDAKIDGAGITYTREVVKKHAATVSFPQTPVVNVESVKIPVQINTSGLRLKIYNNGYIKGTSHHNDPSIVPVIDEKTVIGEYEIDIPLVSIRNDIVFCFIDENDNAVTQAYSYTRDMVAPTIDAKKIAFDNKSITADFTTTSNEVVISGIITDEIATDVVGYVSELYINGYPVSINNAGKFTFTQPLVIGKNDITIMAVDMSGNSSDLTLSVTMIEQKKSFGTKVATAIICLVAIALLIAVIIKNLKPSAEKVETLEEKPTVRVQKATNKRQEKIKPAKDKKETKSEADEFQPKLSVEEQRKAEIERLTAWKNNK